MHLHRGALVLASDGRLQMAVVQLLTNRLRLEVSAVLQLLEVLSLNDDVFKLNLSKAQEKLGFSCVTLFRSLKFSSCTSQHELLAVCGRQAARGAA